MRRPNAARHAQAKNVRIRLRLADGRLEISVRDNGPGIPPDLQQNLFDPFVTGKANGTGLGLALVAKIVGDHGGIVECETQSRRTVFRVLMPMFEATDGRPAGDT